MSIPQPGERVFRIECPACGRRWWRSIASAVDYSMHYASAHLGIPVLRKPPIEIIPLEPKVLRRRLR